MRLFLVTSPDIGTAGAESLGLPGTFKVADPGRPVIEADAVRILTVLRDKASWTRELVPCIFEPAIALALPDRSELLLLLSFTTAEIAAVREDTLLGKWSMTSEAMERLRAVCAKYHAGLGRPTGCGAAERRR